MLYNLDTCIELCGPRWWRLRSWARSPPRPWPVCVCTCIRICVCMCMCICIHTQTHTRTHARTHTHMCICIQTHTHLAAVAGNGEGDEGRVLRLLRCQYLHFSTIKASKLSMKDEYCGSSGVSICTLVPLKQVNWVWVRRRRMRVQHTAPDVSVFVLLYW